MKFLKFVFTAVLATIFFSSCLGDSDSKYEGTFFGYAAYDTESGAGLYVKTSSYARFITSPEIQAKLNPSDCAIISFKAVNPNSGLNNVENVKITTLPNKSYLSTTKPAIDIKDEIFPHNFDYDMAYGGYSADEYFGDNWLYTMQYNSEDDNKIVAYFFYDKDNQEIIDEETGEIKQPSRKDNEMIIDVRFARSTNDGSFTVKGSGSTNFVANLSQVRNIKSGPNYPKPTDDNLNYIVVPVVFRYKRTVQGEDKPKETILGRWSSTGSSDYSYRPFVFEKK